MIQDLIGEAGVLWRALQQFRHIVVVEIADAPGADLAVALQLLERADGFIERNVAAPVQQVEIERIGFQPPQAAFASRDCTGC